MGSQRASFRRRLFAWIYDVLVVIAILMVAAGLELAVVHVLAANHWLVLPVNGDEASFVAGKWWHSAYFLLIAVLFTAYFWVKGGQTLGMRAWRLQVLRLDGGPLSFGQAVLRSLASLAGLSSLWVIVNRTEKLALHDYLAKTQVITLSKEQNRQVYRQEH